MTARYALGEAADALLAVRGGLAVLVAEAPGRTAVSAAALWAALAEPQPLTRVLEHLTSAGLADAPEFAIVELDGPAARVVVRGALTVAVERSGAHDELDGAGVATWRESLVPAFDVLRIGSPVGDGLPLEAGVVRARGVELGAPGSVEPNGERNVEHGAVASPDSSPLTAPTLVPLSSETLVQHALAEQLFEATIVRSVTEAELIGDHDGLTVVGASIPGFAERARPAAVEAPAAPAAPRFVVETDQGVVEPLAPAVIVGRSPSASQVASGAVPRLIVIRDNPDISRTHVRIALEGDTVVVTDLHSRNGTSVRLPGKPPQLLRAGEATAVLDGTVVDLGGTTLTVRSR
ncbi:FHA domain-containing protein [Microcella alkalica]|uniref:FHA domain-containing protein n=1 Tax=Microcella alkalica TaxID=355930 RepID=UPI00145EC73E|nr:FHA domain-containing protein [Microcella alkalica]